MCNVTNSTYRFNGDETVGICYDATGEDIEDEAAFLSVPDSSRLMVFSKSLNEIMGATKVP